jgi:glutaredoxin 3
MIKIITKEYCSYCDLAKTLISSLWFEYEEIDVTNDQEKLNEIVWISWMMTVPQIFKKELSFDNLLGGYSDIEKLNEDWKLLELLK